MKGGLQQESRSLELGTFFQELRSKLDKMCMVLEATRTSPGQPEAKEAPKTNLGAEVSFPSRTQPDFHKDSAFKAIHGGSGKSRSTVPSSPTAPSWTMSQKLKEAGALVGVMFAQHAQSSGF